MVETKDTKSFFGNGDVDIEKGINSVKVEEQNHSERHNPFEINEPSPDFDNAISDFYSKSESFEDIMKKLTSK